MFFMKKYSKEFDYMTKVSSKLINCNKKNCKNEFDELYNYRKKIIEDLFILIDKEQKTISYKNYILKKKIIQKKFDNNKYVKNFLIPESLRIGRSNDKNTNVNYKKELIIYQKEIKQNLKAYFKTEDKKYYEKKQKILLNVIDSEQNINFSKCSHEKCLEFNKINLTIIKKITKKLCKDKKKKSCKIYKMIDKLDFTKFTYKDTIKVQKLIKLEKKGYKGLF